MAIAQQDYLRIVKGLNPGQLSAVTAPEGSVLVVAGAGTGKTTVAVRRIAMYIASGVDPKKILAMTFGNKAARETKDRVSAFIPEGKNINSYTYHAFALRELIQSYQKSDYFKSIGFNGYINLIDDKDSTTFMREARDQLSGMKEALKLLDIKPKRIDSVLTYNRAYGKRADDFMEEVIASTVKLQEGKTGTLGTVSHFVDKIVAHLGSTKDPRADVTESLINFSKSNPVVVDYLIGKLWQQYEKVCRQNNGVDFDDVLILAERLIKNSPQVRKDLVAKFSHFVLDEYQDSNKVQYTMLSRVYEAVTEITGVLPELFHVGDTRQAIFRFRGADAKYMSMMANERPDVKVISLTENYRSSQEILNSANIHAASMGGHVTNGHLTSGNNIEGQRPSYTRFESATDEAQMIVDDIKDKIASGVQASDIAVLYRTSAVKDEIERALANSQVSYAVIGDSSFYDSKEVSDTISFLRMITRPTDHLATSRVIDCFRGVTGFSYRKSVDQMTNMEYFEKQAHLFTAKSKPFLILYEGLLPIKRFSFRFSIRETCQEIMKNRMERLVREGHSIEKFTPEYISEEIQAAHDKYKDIPAFVNHRDLIRKHYDDVKALWHEIYLPSLEAYQKSLDSDNFEEKFQKRLGNIEQLFSDVLNRVQHDVNVTIDTVIEDLMMASDVNTEDHSAVQVLTIHKSKGLEYDHVYLPGLEQNIFFKEDQIDDDRLQDESQVVYVALTRAKKRLHCSSASMRMINGEMIAAVEPLMFLTPELLSTMDVCDKTQKAQVKYDSQAAAWESLDIKLDPAAERLLSALRL